MRSSKQKIREHCKELVSQLSTEQKYDESSSLSRALVLWLEKNGHDRQSLGSYVPMADEIQWHLGFDALGKYRFAFPHYDEKEMLFYEVTLAGKDLQRLGLNLSADFCSKERRLIPELLFIPGLAFTKSGRRLGRGKGHYDRYLANYSGVKVGICWEQCLLEDLPNEVHDEQMDYIVTKKKIYRCDEELI